MSGLLSPVNKQHRALEALRALPRQVPLGWYANPAVENTEALNAQGDADFAGCRASRRTTSGGRTFRGGQCIRHWGATQSTMSRSPEEAQLQWICKDATQAIGLRSLAAGLEFCLSIHMQTGATAAMGMAKRLSLRIVRHVDASLRWMQEHTRNGDMSSAKAASPENPPPDALTKNIDRATLQRHSGNTNLGAEEWRAATALRLVGPRIDTQDAQDDGSNL